MTAACWSWPSSSWSRPSLSGARPRVKWCRSELPRHFPLDVREWRGRRAPDFDANVLRVLAVDDYLNRTYVSPSTGAVGLYVGYYSTQREGDTMHSPLNVYLVRDGNRLPGTRICP